MGPRDEKLRRRGRTPGQKDDAFHRDIQEIVDSVKQLPVLDERSDDEILGYNEQGCFD